MSISVFSWTGKAFAQAYPYVFPLTAKELMTQFCRDFRAFCPEWYIQHESFAKLRTCRLRPNDGHHGLGCAWLGLDLMEVRAHQGWMLYFQSPFLRSYCNAQVNARTPYAKRGHVNLCWTTLLRWKCSARFQCLEELAAHIRGAEWVHTAILMLLYASDTGTNLCSDVLWCMKRLGILSMVCVRMKSLINEYPQGIVRNKSKNVQL